MPCPSQSSWLNHPDYIRWTVQTMKFLIVKPSPLPILIPLWRHWPDNVKNMYFILIHYPCWWSCFWRWVTSFLPRQMTFLTSIYYKFQFLESRSGVLTTISSSWSVYNVLSLFIMKKFLVLIVSTVQEVIHIDHCDFTNTYQQSLRESNCHNTVHSTFSKKQ